MIIQFLCNSFGFFDIDNSLTSVVQVIDYRTFIIVRARKFFCIIVILVVFDTDINHGIRLDWHVHPI